MPALLISVPSTTPDVGFISALIVAAGFGVLTLTLVALHHASRLTVARTLAAVGLSVGAVGVAVSGALALSAPPAHAAAERSTPTYVVTPSKSTPTDLQLPTLELD